MTEERAREPGALPLLSIEDRIARIELRRPHQANRIQPEDVAALSAQCDLLRGEAKSVRAVVLSAHGKYFSAGFDLGSLQASNTAGKRQEDGTAGAGTGEFGRMVDAFEALPQITICALNGSVFGGSTDLALACDFRLGVATTSLRMPAARLGLSYPSVGLRRFVSAVGLRHARQIFLLGEEIASTELAAMGYLHAVVAADELLDRALALASVAAANAPLATAAMKATLNALARGVFNEKAAQAAEAMCLHSADLREGIAAMREKRTPSFTAT
jgi:enoyl-CoA hydratase